MSLDDFCKDQRLDKLTCREFQVWVGDRAKEQRPKLEWLGLFAQFRRSQMNKVPV